MHVLRELKEFLYRTPKAVSVGSVSELLEKHGLQKPVSFVKDTKDNAEEARKLMIRLTRHTGRKSVFQGEWGRRGEGQ